MAQGSSRERQEGKRFRGVALSPLESVRTCFSKYFNFDDYGSRSEYWWFILFVVVMGFVLVVVSTLLGRVFSLLTLIPTISATSRRLHDTNRSGWWQLLVLLPVIGAAFLIYFLAQEGAHSK